MRVFGSKKIMAGVTVGVLSVSGIVGYAYWTTGGSGTGTAKASAGAIPITVVAAVPTGLAPGGAVALSGTFNNTNTFDVSVTALTASVPAVFDSTDGTDISTTCLPGWFTVTGTLTSAPVTVPASTATTAWTGLSLNMPTNTTVNQDACKSATIHITYTPTVQQ